MFFTCVNQSSSEKLKESFDIFPTVLQSFHRLSESLMDFHMSRGLLVISFAKHNADDDICYVRHSVNFLLIYLIYKKQFGGF